MEGTYGLVIDGYMARVKYFWEGHMTLNIRQCLCMLRGVYDKSEGAVGTS